VFTERTSIGLDVHARSVAAAAIDGVTGEVTRTRLTPSYEHIQSWIADLPGPAAVAYEAGPTGFGLYRALTDAGVRCEVLAPSKLQRPAGDRVKTDARDALSCGSQPANISLTARRQPTRSPHRHVEEAKRRRRGSSSTAPPHAHLTKFPTYQLSAACRGGEGFQGRHRYAPLPEKLINYFSGLANSFSGLAYVRADPAVRYLRRQTVNVPGQVGK